MLDRNITRNIVASSLVQVVNYVAPFLVFPYLSRVLSVNSFGFLALSLSICNICKIVTDYGFDLSATYWIAQNKTNKHDVSNYILNVLYVKTLLLVMVLCVVFLYGFFLGDSLILKENKEITIGIVFIIVTQTYQFTWFFNGIERMKDIAYITLYTKVIYVFLVFFFVKSENDIGICLLCYAFINLITSLASVLKIVKSGFNLSYTKNSGQIIYLLKQSWYFFLSRLSVGFYTTACTFFVGTFAGVQQAALYSCAEKLYQAGKSATVPISQAIFPYVSRTSDYKQFIRCIVLFLIPITIASILVFFFSDKILIMIFGHDYIAAANVLQCFYICLIVSFISIMLGYPAFSLFNRLDLANKSVIFSSIIQVFIVATLIYFEALSAINIALSVLLAESITLLVRVSLLVYLYVSRERNDEKNNTIHQNVT